MAILPVTIADISTIAAPASPPLTRVSRGSDPELALDLVHASIESPTILAHTLVTATGSEPQAERPGIRKRGKVTSIPSPSSGVEENPPDNFLHYFANRRNKDGYQGCVFLLWKSTKGVTWAIDVPITDSGAEDVIFRNLCAHYVKHRGFWCRYLGLRGVVEVEPVKVLETFCLNHYLDFFHMN
jgi:hypothetical protein